MIKPPIPADETRRLKALRDLKVLDTPPEERFDRVTRLARRVFAAPIALVSLVDGDRQWFKSRQGLDATETSRDISFCGHAIVDDRILVINDATGDERFCDNPLVTCDPNIRFYAGYPLSAPDGSKVGTLCIIDRKPRSLSKEDLHLLRELGRMIEEEFAAAAQSTTDPVTGLSTQAGLALVGDHLLATCRRMDKPASLLFFQLRNMEQIETADGTNAGDRAIVELTHLLMGSYRDCDAIARISVDTFCVLLVGSNQDGADMCRERLRGSLVERNNTGSLDFDLNLATDMISYKPARHSCVEDMVREGEERLSAQLASDDSDDLPLAALS
ncbi:MAG: diguanylate cyclase [Rhodothermales bacterium]|nr:diguanylate cyclase [Rhodothermales bacterium]